MSEGALLAFGPCCSCGNLFTFDPDTVPSVPIDPRTGLPPDMCGCGDGAACLARAVSQPICPQCMTLRGKIRAAAARKSGGDTGGQ